MSKQILENYLEILQDDAENADKNLQEFWGSAPAKAAAAGAGTGIAGYIPAAYMGFMLIKGVLGLLADKLTQVGRECQGFVGAAKNLCILKYKISVQQEAINKLRSRMGKCNQTNNPYICRQKIQNKLDKMEEQLKRFKDQEKIYLERNRQEKIKQNKQGIHG